ncbi:MAG: monofunctional biosynthetic peptidoglycan transglycosylase [Bacteroidota bacterium]
MIILRWVKAHPWKTLLATIFLIVFAELLTIPWFDVPRLRQVNPEQTALMKQREEESRENGKRWRLVHSWIPLSKIPQYVADAVVVEEDGTFYSHGGFDWYEVGQSMEKNLHTRRFARGGSTITQQLAKNLYLSTSKDPIRKVKEAIITLLLEHYLTKNRILELYLNEIEWGPGIFGIEAASRTYFQKSAANLTPDEALRLAAVIPSPLRHRPDTDSRYVLRRSAMVERRLEARRKGIILTSEEDDSTEDTIELAPGKLPVSTPPDTLRERDTSTTIVPVPPDTTKLKDTTDTEGG